MKIFVKVNDNGFSGSGGSKSDEKSFLINVIPVNDAPELIFGGEVLRTTLLGGNFPKTIMRSLFVEEDADLLNIPLQVLNENVSLLLLETALNCLFYERRLMTLTWVLVIYP